MNKPAGRHKAQQLTVKAIEAISKPGRYGDGGGLYLVVDNKSAKRWLLRVMVHGRRRDIGLGSYRHVGLSDARDIAREYVRVARAGDDPTKTLRKQTAVPDFETLAKAYFEQHKGRWKNQEHRHQWITTLETYVFPKIGKRRIDQISTPEIVAVLSPIWFEKHQTARRIKQRIATVFDDAKGKGHLTGENPVTGVSASLKTDKRLGRPEHFPAMDYRDLPSFIERLCAGDPPTMSRLALEFTILTATRTGEVRKARWSEVDIDKAVWTIPAERMKMAREHRVPLPDRCLQILSTVRPITEAGGWLFEGRKPGHGLSKQAMRKLLERLDEPFTIHGFRSTFRDWCSEQTGFPYAAVERCLAHEPGNKVEAAYARSDLLDRRREIMDAWQAYVLSVVNDKNNVVSISTGR